MIGGPAGASMARYRAHGFGRLRAARRRQVEDDLAPLLTNGSGADAATLARWDVGSRSAAVRSLQQAIGNRAAVTVLGAGRHHVARDGGIGPRPVATDARSIMSSARAEPGLAVFSPGPSQPAPPPDGAQRIRNDVPTGDAAGYTDMPAPGPPDLVVGKPVCHDGQWAAPVQPTTVTPATPVSLYPGKGVHDMDPGPTGQKRHLHVTGPMSALIRTGEEEHLADFEWARHYTYDAAAHAVNTVAAKEAPAAASPEEAKAAARKAVRERLPAELRWAAGADPVKVWLQGYSALAAVSQERDQNGWHDMRSRYVLDPADKKALGVDVADELTRYVDGPEIGKHASAPLMKARFDQLPKQEA